MQSLYLETTICSYLAAWPMGQLVAAARQWVVHDWWRTQRGQYQLFISELVILEASRGDQDAVQRRLNVLDGIEVLKLSDEAIELADRISGNTGLPAKAAADALHIAIAAVEGTDYLMTLNMRHIANAQFRKAIYEECLHCGFEPPQICTPDELMGETVGEEDNG